MTAECTNNKVFNTNDIETLPVEEAWQNVIKTAKQAVEDRDLDDFRDAMKVYQKACLDVTYEEIERSFRANDIGIYLIATEPQNGELLDTHTLVNLAGKRDCKFKMGYFFKKTPRTAKMAEGWPSSEEENLARLKDAGVPYERGIPKCFRCKEMGHTGRDCKEERTTVEETVLKCFNCDEEGHRTRDCTAVRVDRYACRNCKSVHTMSNSSISDHTDRWQGNLGILPPSALNRVQQKVWNARDARKLVTSRRTVPIIPVAVVPVVIAEKKVIWLKNAKSQRTLQLQHAETVSKLDTLARIALSHVIGAR
ncbi:MAG: hypothetical protein L6R41_008065 [Letrouitia leprolyta]|nr:MAG: hypothetical protein L6R41_008065 [Letrouitia leprolyta]